MQNIGSTFKHFSFRCFINSNGAGFNTVLAYAALGVFISFNALAEMPLAIPRYVMLNAVVVNANPSDRVTINTFPKIEISFVSNFVELFTQVTPKSKTMPKDQTKGES